MDNSQSKKMYMIRPSREENLLGYLKPLIGELLEVDMEDGPYVRLYNSNKQWDEITEEFLMPVDVPFDAFVERTQRENTCDLREEYKIFLEVSHLLLGSYPPRPSGRSA